MAADNDSENVNRRRFLESAAAAAGSGLVAIGPAMPAEPVKPSVSFNSSAGNEIPFSREELFAGGATRVFEGRYLNEIAFPLGGIGTGTVSLGGRGQLRDWEIFNRPNKGGKLPFSFVALWCRAAGGQAHARVLETPAPPPFTGAHGYSRIGGEGLPHLESARFFGCYPLARIEFADSKLPLRVQLEAFTPFVPLEVDDSALPCAVLRYELHSLARRPVDAAIAFSLLNPIGYDGVAKLGGKNFPGFGQNICEFARGDGFSALKFSSGKHPPDSPRFGTMALVADTAEADHLPRWAEGRWWDDYHQWWDEFSQTGRFANPPAARPSPDNTTDIATLAPRLRLQPGETRAVTFLLAWHFPVRENYWNREPEYRGKQFRNHYAERFADAWAVAEHARRELNRLERETRAFQRAWSETTLPATVLDAASSQASIIRTNTCMLAEGRRFFAFEGCNDDSGCCPMNCTHVWNYAQALAFLFPELERSMRDTDFRHNLNEDGSMAFRTLIPLGQTLWKHLPAADGQFGCVLKAYREWQMSGDDQWLRGLWPNIKRAIEYAWKQWDADRDGVMEGEQHNTYDIEFYGPNSMMGTLYLAGLRAAERMARALGDTEAAETYSRIAQSGAAKLDRELWNGDYYVQKYDAEAHPKYQFGEGCLSDQLLGQWFAEVVGLGKVLPAAHIRRALHSIYRHNFTAGFQDFGNPQRIYALNDEKALLLCSWPQGKRPALPFVYSDEAWTGIEYQVAAHLIYEGMVEEGLAVVKGVRDRYDGFRRNPWNEIECGSHYARAMASWSLLPALTGLRYSAPEKRIAFGPVIRKEAFRSFFTAGSGWGLFTQKSAAADGRLAASLELRHGRLELAEFRLRPLAPQARYSVAARVANQAVPASLEKRDGYLCARFARPVSLAAGDHLAVEFREIQQKAA
jgi:non-lysosomal glucosylceramidase